MQKGQDLKRACRAEIDVLLGDSAEVVYRSLLPELNESPSSRSTVSLNLHNGSLRLIISSDDTVMLRAGLNTWLRLIKTAYESALIPIM